MKLRSNIDKWNYYKASIDERAQQYIKTILPQLPEAVYSVYPSGVICKKKITGTSYVDGFYAFGKKISNSKVEEIKAGEASIVFTQDKIRINYEETTSFGKCTGSMSLGDFKASLTEAGAISKSEEIKERIRQEEILLQNGHERCQRCKKVVPKETILIETIIGRGRKEVYNSGKNKYESKAVVTHEKLMFCSKEMCCS